ncbi:MAG: chain A cytochrome P460 [Rhizobiaceae bacterium]|nr:chain A cytochrome P460 [Rhizobiaceae bacterium]
MKIKTIFALVTGLATSLLIWSQFNGVATAQMSDDWKPKWTAEGQLELPTGYREWIYLGSPLTPNALNDGEAGFPEYHNVYMHPQAYKLYKQTGEFPEGTILLKELQLTREAEEEDGSRTEVSGRGYFPAAFNGIDIAVKDSSRFAESENWGYFNFGHHAPPYAKTASAAPVGACAACHISNATKDMVFSEFYTILNTK